MISRTTILVAVRCSPLLNNLGPSCRTSRHNTQAPQEAQAAYLTNATPEIISHVPRDLAQPLVAPLHHEHLVPLARLPGGGGGHKYLARHVVIGQDLQRRRDRDLLRVAAPRFG